MIKALIRTGFIITTVIFVFSSCEYENIVPIEAELPDSISFSTDIIPIFEANCNSSGCHNTGGIAPDLTPEYAYNNLMLYNFVDTTITPEQTGLMLKLKGSMEKYILPQDYELILFWVELNAPNN
ncbi:MAG: hypothetical protein JSV22_06690 [Bacteroidales bacterium]|nr:MAG: hypothetical protein JSV22_06690 [Bacteroidales bacterium]